MLFFETSAKSAYNINELFMTSAKDIAKKIETGFYDLSNDNCGIKKGLLGGEEVASEINLNNSKDKKNQVPVNKKCC